MLIRSKRYIAAGSSVLALALVTVSAFAAESGKTNVMIGGQSSKLTAYYRSELLNNDHGVLKTGDNKPTRTTNIKLDQMKLGLAGQLTKDSEYTILLDLVNTTNLIENAKFTLWLTDMIGFSGGKVALNQGGWDNKNATYSSIMNSVYSDNMLPLANATAGNGAAWELNFKAGNAGMINLQLTDDVVKTTSTSTTTTTGTCANRATCRFNQENKQPAWTLEYWGDFGGIKPLVQVGSYDINHSKYFVLGLGYSAMGLDAFLDFIQDQRMFTTVVGTEDKKYTDTLQTITVDLGYTLPKTARPFLKFSSFNNKDATDSAVAGMTEEMKYNTIGATDTGSAAFTDNATQIAAGSSFLMIGDHFRPYVALVNYSGKFQKTGTETESRSSMLLKLGVMGEF